MCATGWHPTASSCCTTSTARTWLPTEDRRRCSRTASASPPIVRQYGSAAATLAAGPLIASLDGGSAAGRSRGPIDLASAPAAATDDWPFLYLRDRFIAPYYLLALAIIIGFAVLLVGRAAQRSGTSLRHFSPHFFVLGVAFLLLETKSLATFSLLFGTTWVVNSLVFFAVLASVLLAIVVNQRVRFRNPVPLYAALFGSIALAVLLPPSSLLIEPVWLRYVVAATLAFAPIFFANLVFSYSFRDTKAADMAFASNLLGAVVGGAIEYVALISGYGWLLGIVGALYAAAWLFATRLRLARRPRPVCRGSSTADRSRGRAKLTTQRRLTRYRPD